MKTPIDLRSDTVTRPDDAMYRALRAAPVGDDVFGDDPTVGELEERAAALLGKEAALFVPSGTMGNAIAIGTHTRPGDEALVEGSVHSFQFEGGGPARLWGVQMRPLAGVAGVVPTTALEAAIRPDDPHFPRTRLVVLEQTNNLAGGVVLPLEYLEQVRDLCRRHGLMFHLDGARIFNAAIASGIPAAAYAAAVDSVMFCLSKGLGAPVGSLVVGTSEFVRRGRRLRKVLGGGMRQAGVLAACGLHALEHNVDRLREDHALAREFAGTIISAGLPDVTVQPPETNMVYVRLESGGPRAHAQWVERLRASGVLAVGVLGEAVRFVFHRDVPPDGARRAAAIAVELLRTLAAG